MKKLLEKAKGLLNKFKSKSKKVKIAMTVAFIAVIVAIGSLIYYSQANKYQVLFSGLKGDDSQVVINSLTDEKIDYKIKGDSILIPKDKVDELRLKLAPSLTDGSKGYELMDGGSSFGMTDEEFKIKKLRMQQGELEKTFKSFNEVSDARVHITQATDSVFAKDKQEGKAAVKLTLKPGKKLSEDQVRAIVALVSGATENIPEKNISVIDDKMNLLTKDLENSDDGSANTEVIGKQHAQEKDYEEKLQEAIVELLEPVVGKNKVKSTVSADLDFDSKQVTETTIDPNKVIVSQDSSKETSNTTNGGNQSQSPVDNNMSNQITDGTNDTNSSAKEEQKTNYDSGKSESKTIVAPGEVKRKTVSVIIDGNLDADTQSQIENLVSNAVGLDATKGDQLTVAGMAFDPSINDEAQSEIDAMNAEEAQKKQTRMLILGAIGAVVLLIALFMIMRKIIANRKKKKQEAQNIDTLIDDTIIPKEPEEFAPIEFEEKSEKTHLEQEIKKYAKEKPEQVVEIIKSWLAENER
ncbi:flagellar basal-body MS-ring/collar protein FliF [Clostridium sp. BJN0001]|uniref:flagellar basal-body MS-ring/collar protein FliF n=1 Tax=Clostridium sp. BJN0001 TaxID=2930219 RepID=UPI001FD0ED56|nr:flagellar basal-body MS-ring/collar protein FliF [Clostridium sp. BJN0001]